MLVGIALDLDSNEDEVAWSEGGSGAACVDTITMNLATIFDDEGDDAAGEVYVLGSVFNVLKDGETGIRRWTDRSVALIVDCEIERELEFSAHGWDTSDDVSAVNGTTIPRVCSDHGSLDPD